MKPLTYIHTYNKDNYNWLIINQISIEQLIQYLAREYLVLSDLAHDDIKLKIGKKMTSTSHKLFFIATNYKIGLN